MARNETGRGNGMRYSEFETEVEKMGFYIGYSPLYLFVVDRYTEKLASISKEFDMWLDTEYQEFPKLPQEQRAALFDLLYVIAKTPLAEREEEKRYRLRKLPIPLLDRSAEKKWLWRQRGTKIAGVDTLSVDHERYQTIFTESEIAQMDITGFEKEPVE